MFTLKHNPEKTDPAYFTKLLDQYGLTKNDVVYFEHNEDAAKSARSVGIPTLFYDEHKQNLIELKEFLTANL